MYDRKKFRSAQNVTDVSFFCSATYTCNSKSIAAECKTIAYEGKGMSLECAKAIGDTEIFGVVPIGGAIVHPR